MNKQQGQNPHIKKFQKDDFIDIKTPPLKTSNFSLPSSPTQLCDPIYTKLGSLSPKIVK